MSTVAIIQARMGSSRLPGKILKHIAGKPALWHVVDRLNYAKKIDQVVVATTTESSDDEVERFCADQGISCFRGSEDDVLDRYYQAAKLFDADPIVRITGDCPAIDPALVDLVLEEYCSNRCDAAGSTETFPDGLDVTVYSFAALERAWREAKLPSEREHVGPYISGHPELFKTKVINNDKDLSKMRWTLDEEADLKFLREIFDRLYREGEVFYMADVLAALEAEPHLVKINSGITRNEGYLKSLKEDEAHLQHTSGGGRGQELYAKAKKLIPGGTQLLSKRPELFLPGKWPAYYREASGVEIVDLDGNVFIDFGIMGVGACILGYADPEVDAAARDAIGRGVMSTLNVPEEVELAELLCRLHPWAQMARFTRSGGEAMSVAVRIARAHTKKDKIAFCGYHGWTDWYLAANLTVGDALGTHLLPGLEPAGVPAGLRKTALPFHYNQIDELIDLVAENPGELAAIVMEPQRGQAPAPGFLAKVREIADDIGAVLIFDEITTGFRATTGGIHLLLDVDPDIAVFAKAMANGYAMAAVIGSEDTMQSAQSTFISSTNWTEGIGPAAALATIRKHEREDVAKHIGMIGDLVTRGWVDAARESGLALHTSGLSSLCHFNFDHEDAPAMTTLFTQLMLDKGYLAYNQFKPSFAHKESHVENYLIAVAQVFEEIARALEGDGIHSALSGPIARPGFYRLTE